MQSTEGFLLNKNKMDLDIIDVVHAADNER